MSRARALGRGLAKGLGTTLMAGGVGAVGYGLHAMSSKFTAPDGDMSKFKSRCWIPGAAMVAAGHMMHRRPKLQTAGIALAAAGGFAMAENLTLRANIVANEKGAGSTAPAQPKVGVQGLAPYGLEDTGALLGPGDTGAVLSASDTVGAAVDDIMGM